MLLVIRRIIKDQYIFWFWQLSLENWICQRASITTKDDTKTMELTDLVGKKSCYSVQGPRPLSKSKHQVLNTRGSFNYHNINPGICKTLINNAKIFNSEHILYTQKLYTGNIPLCTVYACTKRNLYSCLGWFNSFHTDQYILRQFLSINYISMNLSTCPAFKRTWFSCTTVKLCYLELDGTV